MSPGIKVSIVGGTDKGTSAVTASGCIEHVITDEDRITFGVEDKQLKDAIRQYFGKEPIDAFVRSPTPWNDLFKTYGWGEVRVVLIPESTDILDFAMEPTILKTQRFENKGSQPVKFHVNISESVAEATSTTWTTLDTLSVAQKISYDLKFFGAGAGGETSFSYSKAWGEGGQESRAVTVGTTTGVEVTLDPGQSATAVLLARRGVLKVRIQYRAYLVNGTAVHYHPPYEGHYFWWLPIDEVMKAARISNARTSTEEIEVGYYSDSAIEVTDDRQAVLARRPLRARHGA